MVSSRTQYTVSGQGTYADCLKLPLIRSWLQGGAANVYRPYLLWYSIVSNGIVLRRVLYGKYTAFSRFQCSVLLLPKVMGKWSSLFKKTFLSYVFINENCERKLLFLSVPECIENRISVPIGSVKTSVNTLYPMIPSVWWTRLLHQKCGVVPSPDTVYCVLGFIIVTSSSHYHQSNGQAEIKLSGQNVLGQKSYIGWHQAQWRVGLNCWWEGCSIRLF